MISATCLISEDIIVAQVRCKKCLEQEGNAKSHALFSPLAMYWPQFFNNPRWSKQYYWHKGIPTGPALKQSFKDVLHLCLVKNYTSWTGQSSYLLPKTIMSSWKHQSTEHPQGCASCCAIKSCQLHNLRNAQGRKNLPWRHSITSSVKLEKRDWVNLF